MALNDLIRKLLPNDDHFYGYLEELGRLGHDAAVALARFKSAPAEEVQKAVQEIEHKADNVVRQAEDALARTFVTPIDREDLHRLTSELDDIVDRTNLSARAFSLYRLSKLTPPMMELGDKLVLTTALIRDLVPLLRAHRYGDIVEGVRKVRQVEKEADTIYRAAIAQMFDAPAAADYREFVKQKEALDDLEAAVDYCDKVADTLSNLAVKHG